jgi:glutathione S-transferase
MFMLELQMSQATTTRPSTSSLPIQFWLRSPIDEKVEHEASLAMLQCTLAARLSGHLLTGSWFIRQNDSSSSSLYLTHVINSSSSILPDDAFIAMIPPSLVNGHDSKRSGNGSNVVSPITPLFSPYSIARYLSSITPTNKCLMSHTIDGVELSRVDQANVDQWIDFDEGRLRPAIIDWIKLGYSAHNMPLSLVSLFDEVQAALRANVKAHSRYIVGNGITLADIVIFTSIHVMLTLSPSLIIKWPTLLHYRTMMSVLPLVRTALSMVPVVVTVNRPTTGDSPLPLPVLPKQASLGRNSSNNSNGSSTTNGVVAVTNNVAHIEIVEFPRHSPDFDNEENRSLIASRINRYLYQPSSPSMIGSSSNSNITPMPSTNIAVPEVKREKLLWTADAPAPGSEIEEEVTVNTSNEPRSGVDNGMDDPG